MLVPSSSFQTQLTGKDFAIDIHLTYKLRFVDQQLLTYNIFFSKSHEVVRKEQQQQQQQQQKQLQTIAHNAATHPGILCHNRLAYGG